VLEVMAAQVREIQRERVSTSGKDAEERHLSRRPDLKKPGTIAP
jgi:hypothetical protein